MHAHHGEGDGTVVDDADNHHAHVATSRPACVNAEPEVAEEEGVQGGGVAPNQVVDQAFDLAGCCSDFASLCGTGRIAKAEQNVLNFAV